MINAKYCSRCGHELKLPQEPIVCPNCHARNAPIANYCRNCGAELKIGLATKICKRCGNEVPIEQSVCSCGYSFANQSFASPIPVRTEGGVSTGVMGQNGMPNAVNAANAEQGKGKKGKKVKEKKNYNTKGGRGFAIVSLVLLLIFAYFVIVPSCVIRPSVISNFDKGIVTLNPHTNENGATETMQPTPHYGYDLVFDAVIAIMNGNFTDMLKDIPQLIMTVLVVIFALTVLVHFIVCLVRSIKPRRSKKPNWLFFTLAIISTIAVGLIAVFNYVNVPDALAKIAGFFKLAGDWSLGYVLYAIPGFYWIFFLYSLIAKARVMKEQTTAPVAGNTIAG